MTEIIDQASALETMMREQAIQAHRINRDAVSATHCVECDEPLSDARRKAYPGCTTCVRCQEEWEILIRQGRG